MTVDAKLREDYGVYDTPVQIVGCQVRLVHELLEQEFNKKYGIVDDAVTVLDPAVGTGTYLLAALDYGLGKVAHLGQGIVAEQATVAARNYHAFEVLVGPYSVAHLRLRERFRAAGGSLPSQGVGVYLADILESPYARERRSARAVKSELPVLVCLGNPPYDRHDAAERSPGHEDRPGGWVRWGEHGEDGSGILSDFTEPAKDAGAGGHLKNLYNLYVYFWRWALWKVLDSTGGPGIVSFITASSFLRGPGFVGMRQKLRENFDEIWILDLEGDNLGPRKTENVFAIQSPVAITVGVRYGEPQPHQPAKARYARLTGTREEKLATLDTVARFADVTWQDCPDAWQRPLLPEGSGDYFSWPLLTDLFPWQHSGVQFKRTWPIAPTREALTRRWKALLSVSGERRAELFDEGSDRKISKTYPRHDGRRPRAPSIESLDADTASPSITRYAYRSFDRQWALVDGRLAARIRPSLWQVAGTHQIYLTSLLTGVLGEGPAASVAATVPDLHHFCNRGAQDVIPLWRDAAATVPNITNGTLDALGEGLGARVDPEDLFAYTYGILASTRYTELFAEELAIPGPRIPITRDPALFQRTAALGRRLIWLHTFGERFVPQGERPRRVPEGRAANPAAVSQREDAYPQSHAYDPAKQELRVGDGVFAPVPKEVWEFSVSGLQVVKSWLDYRMKEGAGRRASELDGMSPPPWTMSSELLELLHVLEATVAMQPELQESLEAVVSSEVFAADDLPTPGEAERDEPTVDSSASGEETGQEEIAFP